jgi:uncharacterized Zn finger protein (UPF0148 family)
MMNEEYPYPLFDERGQVACQICGKSFLTISPQHLKKHNIKFADYFKRYPNAPKTSDQFDARSKYGKNKTLFKEQEDKSMLGDELIVNEEPEVEEFPMQKELERIIKFQSPMERTKNKILDHLRLFYSNMEMDYSIRQYGRQDRKLRFEFITDFSDPVLKVVVQFPDTFWHNREDHIADSVKRVKLEQFGWVVVDIYGNNPKLNFIEKVIQDTF